MCGVGKERESRAEGYRYLEKRNTNFKISESSVKKRGRKETCIY